ncbi:hypothetical protein ETI01_07990 [Macrococcoides caseolyticum]|uniref:dUTP diphosphatase n=1 Tax=Macrococcoides caseolyticum TaxID=69966 RepID=UPI00105C78AE|nr:dUTP diphosphatase [Macrococcus caseolyticus]TDM23335.1 hypothetical protein ETI01_07990 [Macrococcus caseolyticus]
MIKMTTELFEKFSKKQEELDSMIREKFGININEWKRAYQRNHEIALKVELAEFVNECHDVWKYWKQKSVVPERILDEAVDVIHFLHLILNKSDESNTELLNTYIHDLHEENVTLSGMLDDLLDVNTEYLYYTYAQLLLILERYAFTLDDIEQAYDRKNAENHARQNRNY